MTNGTAGSLTAEAARVLDERNEWQRVLGLSGEKIIDIFIDNTFQITAISKI